MPVTLADVPTDELDGESVRVFHYFNAVCSMTTATLYERYRGVDATAKGDKNSIDSTIDEMWRDMRWSVARIQDKALHCGANLMKAYALQGDTLDAICARYYGRTEGVVETVLRQIPACLSSASSATARQLPETEARPEPKR
jgi:phage tail protein X